MPGPFLFPRRPAALAALAALAAAGLPAPAAAQAAAQRVEVIGSAPLPGASQSRAAVPGNVQAASSEDLRDAQSLDLSEYMARRFGSVHITEAQGNPLQADLSFRGFTASPLLGTTQGLAVVMDGVRMNAPFGDVVSWDLIPRNALASAALLPGSQPVFGLNALGGALVLQTHDGLSHPGGEFTLRAGSGHRRVAELAYGRDLGHGLDAFAAAQWFQEDGWRDASPSAQRQFFGKLGWRSGATTLKLSLAHADTDLTGNGMQEGRWLAQRWAGVFTQPDETRNRSSLLNLVATHALSPALTLSAQVYGRRLRSSTFNGDANEGALDQNLYFEPTAGNVAALQAAGYSGIPSAAESAATTAFPTWRCVLAAVTRGGPDTACTGLLNRSATQQGAWGFGLQATLQGDLGGRVNQLVLGLGHERSRVDFQQSAEFGAIAADRSVIGTGVFADGTQGADNAFDARVDLAARSHTTSLYAADTLTLAPGLNLLAGGRFNRNVVAMTDRLDPTGSAGTLNGHHVFSRFNPTVGWVAGLGGGVSLQGSVGESSRAPTATELGCADPADPCRLPNAMASDPPLRQVVTRSMELGLRGGDARLQWNAGVFRADNRDDILFVAAEAVGTGYFRNVGRTRRQGLEAGLDGRTGSLSLGARLTLLEATFQSTETLPGTANSSNSLAAEGYPGLGEGGTVSVKPGDRLPLIPRRLLKLYGQWRAAPGLSLGADLVAVSGVIARGNENNRHQPDGVVYLGPGRSAGYGVVNLDAAWQFAPGWELTAKLNNLFDRRYTTGAVLGATPFNDAGTVDARQVGAYADSAGDVAYRVRHTTFFAPGAPRQLFVGLRFSFD